MKLPMKLWLWPLLPMKPMPTTNQRCHHAHARCRRLCQHLHQ